MPVESKAQNAAMHEAAEGHSSIGIPASVGREFVEASHGENVSALPEHAGGGAEEDEHTKEMKARADHLHRQGLISDAERKKHHARADELAKAKRPKISHTAAPGAAEEDGERESPEPEAA